MSNSHFNNLPDNLYFDIVVSNLDNTNTAPKQLYYQEIRVSPFVYCPEQYEFSITRFSLDTPSLPVWIPVIQPNQSDINLTIYSVTMTYKTFSYQQFMEFSPQNVGAVLPSLPSNNPYGLQDNSTGYYYVYSIQYFVNLVNQMFASCFNGLNTASGGQLNSTYAPVMTYDTQNQIFILNSDVLFYNPVLANPINIYFNPATNQILNSFPVMINFNVNVSYGMNFHVITNNFGVNTLQSTSSTYGSFPFTAIQTVQERSSIPLLNPITAITFTTSKIPIIPTSITAPALYINNNLISTGNNNNVQNIITDFETDANYINTISYNPTAEYRMSTLTGNQPLNGIDIFVFWRDRTGTLNPFFLTTGSTLTMKILFRRKLVNKLLGNK